MISDQARISMLGTSALLFEAPGETELVTQQRIWALACEAEGSRRQPGPPMKHSEKMIQIREPRLCGDVGDREAACFQEFLGMVDSDTQDFVQHGAPEFHAKRTF